MNVSPLKKHAVNTALALGSLTAALLFSEAVVRMVLPPPQRVHVIKDPHFAERNEWENRNPFKVIVPKRLEGVLYLDTPYGRRLRANATCYIQNQITSKRSIIIQTNSLGYRNREVPADKTAVRILFLGDSITFADYAMENETFVRLVEQLAYRRGRRWETINAGVGAISLDNEIAILKETGLSTKPDIVIVDWYLNDFLPSKGVYITPLPAAFEWSRFLYYAAQIAGTVAQQIRGAGRKAEASSLDLARCKEELEKNYPPGPGDPSKDVGAFNAEIIKNYSDWGSIWTKTAWDYMRPMLDEIKRLSREHHFQPLFVCFPHRIQVESEFINNFPQVQLQKECARLGIPVLDMLPRLRELFQAGDRELYYDGCHPTPHGHEVICGIIYPFIEDNMETREEATGHE